ncbi:tetratricopeptide repeat protein [Hydrogenobacter hydrogenophilus]|uniref:Tetratricopeptide repeat-containing protein n=1 Tax=Hydrogenobacter hydrogenophilus TaxID=35835 RepID=A0A285P173_9AQUI|nr:tetratricopeptide repeat protein [Hydrogenobacter hydrogenophilus]SNZ15208.1 Tetratricopeptide repeat-containing protein [Hydrogenobacter hydrogenophilus]
MKLKMALVMILALVWAGVSYAQKEIIDCINYLKAGDYQRAIKSGQMAVKLYPRSADAYSCLGEAYRMTGEINLAIENLKKAEAYATRDVELMYIYISLGDAYGQKGDLDNALFYHSKSLNLARKLGDREMEAGGLTNIANVFRIKGEPDKALEYYEEALRLYTDEKGKALTYNNIAGIYLDKGDYKKAIEYFKKAIEISERYGEYHASGDGMLNLGDTYRKIKDFKNAEYYLSEGLKRVQKVGDKYAEAKGLAFFGLYFRDKGDIKSAREHLNKAYEIFKSIGAEGEASVVLKDLSKLEEKKENKEEKKENKKK